MQGSAGQQRTMSAPEQTKPQRRNKGQSRHERGLGKSMRCSKQYGNSEIAGRDER